MKVAILQRDIIWADPAANVARADAAIRDLPSDVRLVVLPEMFSTGFVTDPEGIAESDHSETLEWMQHTAADRNCAVAGSVAVRAESVASAKPQFFNRFYFVKPDGTVFSYDKRHLFTYGGEHLHYTAGDERVVVEWGGIRFLLQVCYDLRFPVWSRNHDDYDCALYVASWPTPRIEAWNTLLHARAIENQCYVVGVNRVGSDPACHYCGGSVVVDAYGRDVAACPRDTESAAVAELDIEALLAFRKKFPVLKDRDI